MSSPPIFTPSCHICRLADTDPDARLLVDAWLMGEVNRPDVHAGMVKGKKATGAEVAAFLALRTGYPWRRQAGTEHRRTCLTGLKDPEPSLAAPEATGEFGEVEGRRVMSGEVEMAPDFLLPAPSVQPIVDGAPLVDERSIDAYVAEGLGTVRAIRHAITARARSKKNDEPVMMAPESAFFIGFGATLERLLRVRPYARASTLNDGLPVPQPGMGQVLGQPNRVEPASTGVQGLLARVRKEQADPPPIPGDGDDDPIENGRGSQILDEEARREAEEAAREAEGDEVGEERGGEGESASAPSPPPPSVGLMPDVALQQASSPPSAPDPPPAPPPPASAPQLRVVVGGGAQKAGEHGEPAWMWKPGAGSSG